MKGCCRAFENSGCTEFQKSAIQNPIIRNPEKATKSIPYFPDFSDKIN
jgi:hypothetical protein